MINLFSFIFHFSTITSITNFSFILFLSLLNIPVLPVLAGHGAVSAPPRFPRPADLPAPDLVSVAGPTAAVSVESVPRWSKVASRS